MSYFENGHNTMKNKGEKRISCVSGLMLSFPSGYCFIVITLRSNSIAFLVGPALEQTDFQSC